MQFLEDVWIKILMMCDAPDIVACIRTCKDLKKIADSTYLWKQKWAQLVSRCDLEFVKLYDGNLNHKEASIRLHYVLQLSNIEFLRCSYCMGFSCKPVCVEDHGARVVVDIGNKFTWIVTPSFGVRRHFTMYGIPKKEESSKSERRVNGPFCMFCNPVKLYREKKRASNAGGTSCNKSCYTQLQNGFCTDTAEILGIPNMDVVSPAAALLKDDQFPIMQDFIGHLFHQMGLIPSLQKPNAILVFCEPLGMSNALRKHLLHYLFQRIRVSRVCLVSKPLATCAMLGLDTCIVVDSGALCTSVAVILNGKVAPGRWRNIPVGGWHVAENLKEAMKWQPEEFAQIPVSYLDALAVKEKCRLSYNFANEERRKVPARREHINLRVDSYADYKQYWRVSLGSELYVAPELMYTSLGLPQVIRDLTEGLSEPILKDCLSHILLTGGNTDLIGFKTRVARDLRDLLPEYSTVLDVKTCPGSSSWSVAMGSTYIAIPQTDYTTFDGPKRITGMPFWMTREQYVLFGCDRLS